MHPVLFIVFLPLVAAIIASLGGRWIGKTAAKVVSELTGAPSMPLKMRAQAAGGKVEHRIASAIAETWCEKSTAMAIAIVTMLKAMLAMTMEPAVA